MLLTNEHILEFQELYQKEFGKEISKEAAYESAIQLITLVELKDQLLTDEDLKNVEASRREIKESINGITPRKPGRKKQEHK